MNEKTTAERDLPNLDADFPRTGFEKAADYGEETLAGEFWAFLAENKKWWLLPIVAVMLLLGVLMVAASSGAAPFIYALF